MKYIKKKVHHCVNYHLILIFFLKKVNLISWDLIVRHKARKFLSRIPQYVSPMTAHQTWSFLKGAKMGSCY